MKTKNLFTVAVVSAGLAIGVTAQAKEREHEEQTISSSDVPAAVQQAAQAQAKGGTIIRWEKEGANFEAVIDKNGKQIGVEMDASGKVLSKHNEAKEHQEKALNTEIGWNRVCPKRDLGWKRGEDRLSLASSSPPSPF